jgi:hypothetical protein
VFVCNVCYLSVVLLYYRHRVKAQLQFNKYIYIYIYTSPPLSIPPNGSQRPVKLRSRYVIKLPRLSSLQRRVLEGNRVPDCSAESQEPHVSVQMAAQTCQNFASKWRMCITPRGTDPNTNFLPSCRSDLLVYGLSISGDLFVDIIRLE